MATWTVDTVNANDQNYLSSYTAVGWQALTVVIDVHGCDLVALADAAKQSALLTLFETELGLTKPTIRTMNFTGGKLVVATLGSNTATIRYMTATGSIYIELFITAPFPPEYITQEIEKIFAPITGGTYNICHILPRV